MTATVFIDGEVGTTGLQIKDRLLQRDDLELLSLDEAKRKDPTARREALQTADVSILCLPDAAAIEAVELAANSRGRLIDASTAHRVNPDWVYGFAEMTRGHRNSIANARYVSNPGCYPTGAIALLRPLREAGLLPEDHAVTINALSGYSGGGKSLIAEFEKGEAPVGFVYGTGQNHKHLPELKRHALLADEPIFVPSVGNFAQGMIVQMALHLNKLAIDGLSPQRLDEVLRAHYEGCHFVDVLPFNEDQGRIDPQAMNGTNGMQLMVAGSSRKSQVVLIAVLDNLGKGASGAAVQNMNIMLGLDDRLGISLPH